MLRKASNVEEKSHRSSESLEIYLIQPMDSVAFQ